MKKTTRFGLCVMALGASALVAQNTPNVAQEITDTRDSISTYVGVRQDIARDSNAWQAEKEIIENRIALFEQEKADLEKSIASATDKASSAQKVIADKQSEINRLTSAADVVKNRMPDYEAKLTEIIPLLPKPLRDKIAPLTRNLGRGNTSARMAVVIGILNEMERFNSQLTFDTETKDLGDGRNTSVDVMYLGLAQAYYVDQAGTIAGVGVPAAGGWQWTENNELAPKLLMAIKYYKGDVTPAEFVELPITVKKY